MMSDELKIMILVDDIAGEGISREHGFSLWIEAGARRILFDTGQGATLPENVERLGIDIDQTEFLVLSHGHYDHGGGLQYTISRAGNLHLYCHPDAVIPRFAIRGKTVKSIGISEKLLEAVNSLAPQNVHWLSSNEEISDGIWVTGFIPRKTNYEDVGGPFYLDKAGMKEDPINDDMAAWIHTDKGLIICVGCSHAGLINTINHICELSRESRIRAIIGGFHLIEASEQRLGMTIEALQSMKPEMLVPCHCTGERATGLFREALGERTMPGFAGMTLEF